MILSYEAVSRHIAAQHVVRPQVRFLRLSLFSLSLVLIFCAQVFSQDTTDQDIIRVRTDLVSIPVYVTDKNGHRIADLTQVDFEVRDEGQIVKIEHFAIGTERIALVFALDASGSTDEILTQQRQTALALFSRFGKESEVAVLRFAEKAEVIAPFSGNSNDAIAAFEFKTMSNHRTAIFDGVTSAIHMFDNRPRDAAERKIIIVISDGLDTVSSTSVSKVIELASNSGVSIYSIQIPLYTPIDGKLRPRPATKGYRQIAEKTGGRFFLAGNARAALENKSQYDLTPVFQAIEDDLRGQYVLGYYPDEEERDGRFHVVDIGLKSSNNRNLRVHVLRKGYIAKR